MIKLQYGYYIGASNDQYTLMCKDSSGSKFVTLNSYSTVAEAMNAFIKLARSKIIADDDLTS